MSTYVVQMIGSDSTQQIDADSAHHAVETAAGCDWRLVCLPIWRDRTRECYMPRDDSGRQWLVSLPDGSTLYR
jgi:hypothetical protein